MFTNILFLDVHVDLNQATAVSVFTLLGSYAVIQCAVGSTGMI